MKTSKRRTNIYIKLFLTKAQRGEKTHSVEQAQRGVAAK